MAAGKDVRLDDLPPELLVGGTEEAVPIAEGDWRAALRDWIEAEIRLGHSNIAKEAIDAAESILIRTALGVTRGRRQEAAKLLGYGRNTLTRKIAELQLDV